MPVLLHASMSSVPAGTVRFFPSTVSVTSATKIPQLKPTSSKRIANKSDDSPPVLRYCVFHPSSKLTFEVYCSPLHQLHETSTDCKHSRLASNRRIAEDLLYTSAGSWTLS